VQVKSLADLTNISADTVRYYTRIGLLNPRKNKINGYREFSQRDYQRLRFILSARQLGFTIADIELIISEAESGNTPCPLVRELISQRLGETEERFNEMAALREKMSRAIVEWHQKPDKAPTGDMICHLIEEFEQQDELKGMGHQT